MEFPFVSKVSIESQKLLMETLQMIQCRELAKVDLEEMQTDLKIKVLTEQEEFQKFVYKHAKANHHLCNYIHPNG
ncbi:unnamed protein product [Porites lobata]|uniref:Uncharacterized protein n=1 Tax=Porites lobata TaxID=104759 RepID=A0ABN8QY02_9CNID|nr:unnamed protein product [Porites lobata]